MLLGSLCAHGHPKWLGTTNEGRNHGTSQDDVILVPRAVTLYDRQRDSHDTASSQGKFEVEPALADSIHRSNMSFSTAFQGSNKGLFPTVKPASVHLRCPSHRGRHVAALAAVQVGDKAPDFQLPDQVNVKTSALRHLVLDFSALQQQTCLAV